jgi:5'-methylthioadenosine phosphorylase
MPSELNYRANIYGMKTLGARALLSISAVGSMKEDIHPLELVVPDQFYDLTKRRVTSFFGDGIVAHVGMAHPVCGDVAAALAKAGSEVGARVHRGGTYICIEGPQFSTKGESEVHRRWGMSVIGMTNMPEAKLAREAELCYATLCLVTDYDVWHDEHDAVTVEAVVANLIKNVATAKEVLRRVIPRVPASCGLGCSDALQSAVITNPKAFPPKIRKRLDFLLGKYFPAAKRGPRRG